MSDRTLSPIDVMRRWFSPQRTPELLAETVVWRLSAGYPVPHRAWVGRDTILKDFLPCLRAQFASWGAVVANMIEAEGGRIVTLGHYEGSMTDGRAVKIPFLHVWTVQDGQITALDAVADWACLPPASPAAP